MIYKARLYEQVRMIYKAHWEPVGRKEVRNELRNGSHPDTCHALARRR